MSLLMQALKKAERAKLNHLQEEELAKPSEEFDAVLALAPQDAAPARPAPAAPAARLDIPELSLSPLIDEPPLSATGHAAAPAPEPARPEAARPEAARPDATRPDAPRPDAARPDAARPKFRQPAPPKAASGAFARLAGTDARSIRLAALGGTVALIVSVFGYQYWQAVNSPGAGSKLPMVPMPPPDSGTSAAPQAQVLVAPPADTAVPPTAPPPARPAEAEAPPPRQSQTLTAGTATPEAAAGGRGARPEALPQRAPAPASADGGDIKVRRSSQLPQVPPAVQNAYQAFSGGDLAAARLQYGLALRDDPNNRDALLGLAAVALRQNQPDLAAQHYLRLLELDPNDGDAVAGLAGLRSADTLQSESRIKAMLQRTPDAGPLLFALGNLYAQQARWPEAQQYFFRAFGSMPANADYAFNLAVSLDRLNQGKLALNYYQRALALATNNPGAFDHGALRRRLQELAAAGARPAATPAP